MPFADDPNALPIDPNAEPEPQPEATPEPPPMDEETAIQIVAQKYGWDPRVTDYELRETRQRKEELARKERELAAREDRLRSVSSYEPPQGYEQDPIAKTLYEIKGRLDRQDEERRQERERDAKLARLTQDLDSQYETLMARVPNKVDRQAFFRALQEVYPEQELLERVGVDRASQIVYRYMTANPLTATNGYQPQRPSSRRDPIIIPGASTGGSGPPSGAVMPLEPRRANEPEDQFRLRYEAWIQQFTPGTGALRDGIKVSSG